MTFCPLTDYNETVKRKYIISVGEVTTGIGVFPEDCCREIVETQ